MQQIQQNNRPCNVYCNRHCFRYNIDRKCARLQRKWVAWGCLVAWEAERMPRLNCISMRAKPEQIKAVRAV